MLGSLMLGRPGFLKLMSGGNGVFFDPQQGGRALNFGLLQMGPRYIF